MSRFSDYQEQQLGLCGYVLCGETISYRLRPDLWPSRASVDISGPESRKYLTGIAAKEPIKLFIFEGEGLQGFGAAFNIDTLAERIWAMSPVLSAISWALLTLPSATAMGVLSSWLTTLMNSSLSSSSDFSLVMSLRSKT